MIDRHRPVLLDECLSGLAVKPGGVYVDCTLNGGGHARAILEKSAPDGQVIGLDMDARMIANSREKLAPYGARMLALERNFAELSEALAQAGVSHVDGILADLGLSSNQLDAPERGLSFRAAGPLDMRMDGRLETSAEDIVRDWSEDELVRILRDYGEERFAKRIARAIKQWAATNTKLDTLGLADTVAQAIPKKMHPVRIHPATRSFQALRIAVNRELETLELMLPQALDALKPGGRLAIITYHSLEDRIVARQYKEWAKGCICPPRLPKCVCGLTPKVRIPTKKPITASTEELAENPRARSARLRIAERTAR